MPASASMIVFPGYLKGTWWTKNIPRGAQGQVRVDVDGRLAVL